MGDLKKLKSDAKGKSVLYVEDNNALRENAGKFLRKIFDKVDTAENGLEGFKKFKENKHSIVISDIKMPQMDGLELSKKIKEISPHTKVIIMSAYDDSEYLMDSIEIGVYRYLKKPVNVSRFAEILDQCLVSIAEEENASLFNKHIIDVFNYQSSMVVMLNKREPIFANQMFLDFFEIDKAEEFLKKHLDFGNIFLKHSGFLYDKADKTWFEEISSNPQKLYNIKILDSKDNPKHFILKYQKIPDKESFGILSFDDITELNLLSLFDSKELKKDEKLKNDKEMFKLLDVIKRNNAKITIYNYYKGLSITNDAIISNLDDESVTIKTKYTQQKAIQMEKKAILLSEALPFAIECLRVNSINFENQTIKLSQLSFIESSPTKRKTVRIVPEEKHTVSLFLGENKLHADVRIEDISLEAVRLKLDLLPPSLEEGSSVTIDMVLELDNKPLIINTQATLFKKMEQKHSFSLIFMFDSFNKGDLTKYITKRQMAIIREFKGRQNG